VRYAARVDGHTVRLELDERGRLVVDGEPASADAAILADGAVVSIILDGRSHEVILLQRSPRLRVSVDGREADLAIADEREEEARAHDAGGGATEIELRAPMPGLIVAVHASEGAVIEEGGSLCTLEAMKMENEIIAPRRGRVRTLRATAGSKVNGGDLLAVVSPE
jgi:acetyl-CoA/propionyl-CoA carboxylase biotin carboxyl carrier protein